MITNSMLLDTHFSHDQTRKMICGMYLEYKSDCWKDEKNVHVSPYSRVVCVLVMQAEGRKFDPTQGRKIF